MSSITRSRLEVDYDKGVSGEFGIAKSSRLAQAIGVLIMLAIFAAAFAMRFWAYVPAG